MGGVFICPPLGFISPSWAYFPGPGACISPGRACLFASGRMYFSVPGGCISPGRASAFLRAGRVPLVCARASAHGCARARVLARGRERACPRGRSRVGACPCPRGRSRRSRVAGQALWPWLLDRHSGPGCWTGALALVAGQTHSGPIGNRIVTQPVKSYFRG
jgi:hypothetical protein